MTRLEPLSVWGVAVWSNRPAIAQALRPAHRHGLLLAGSIGRQRRGDSGQQRLSTQSPLAITTRFPFPAYRPPGKRKRETLSLTLSDVVDDYDRHLECSLELAQVGAARRSVRRRSRRADAAGSEDRE